MKNNDTSTRPATLEDILLTYFGLSAGRSWEDAYSLMVECLHEIGCITGTSVDAMVSKLDRIDTREGEV